MILAGIDEAGYGPLLGPLVVGCSAFAVDGADGDDLPDLWRLMKKLVSRKRCRFGRKLHINDSKLVYAPDDGLKELERSMLVMSHQLHESISSTDDLLKCLASHVLQDLPVHPFYHVSAAERFPIENDAMAIKLLANGLRAEMKRVNVRVVHLA